MHNHKAIYYVNVQAGEILADPPPAGYDFKIRANLDQYNQLHQLMKICAETDGDTALRAMTPGIQYHNDTPNDNYDFALKNLYQMLYRLGDREARQHIDSMNLFS